MIGNDTAYLNVSSTNNAGSAAGSPVALENNIFAENPVSLGSHATTGNPISAVNSVTLGMSVPASSSAMSYYNIPKPMPRNSHSQRSAGGSYASNSLPPNVSGKPLVPQRRKTSPAYRNCSVVVKNPSKDCAPHPYYVFDTMPHANRLPARSRNIARSKSLNNIRSSSPSRKEKPPTHSNSGNNSGGVSGDRLRRRYSVGDIVHKLQAFVSGGLPLKCRLARSMSRFSMTHSADPAAAATKVSPDQTPDEDGFAAPGLKQRSTSEILHKSSQPEDVIPARKSPSPEKDVPPVPPPRLVVRPKPAAKMKVF